MEGVAATVKIDPCEQGGCKQINRNFATAKLMTPVGDHGTKDRHRGENYGEKLSLIFLPCAPDIPGELSIYSTLQTPFFMSPFV